MNFVEAKKKENLDMKIMVNNVNASKNILKEGLKNISAWMVEYTGGDEIRPTSLAHSVKPEAPSPLGKG